MRLGATRAMVRAVLAGALDAAAFVPEAAFGLAIPTAVPGVPVELLDPRATWRDPAAYDAQARKLARMFRENFEQYRAHVPASVAEAGPAV
jgi:phosphoenolpyruvate carboxykinase (ATP)